MSPDVSGGECWISLVNADVKFSDGDDSGLISGETGSETSRIASGRDRPLARPLDSADEVWKMSVFGTKKSGLGFEYNLALAWEEFSNADSEVARDANSAVCSRRP